MSHRLFTWITTPVVFGIWIYIAVSGVKAYLRLTRSGELSPFILRKELRESAGPEADEAIQRWRHTTRRLFLIWVLTALSDVLLAAIIDHTIGFTD